MEVLEISNSSAIAKISFTDKEVGVAYTSNPEHYYIFECDTPEDVKTQVQSAESIGKLISMLKKNGTLKIV
jgi:hypothetical protein